MSDRGFDILYDSPACVVVSKPPGLLTQAPPGIDSLEVRIKNWLRQQGAAGQVYLGVPHRLDRAASGAMVFGKEARATRRLARQFERRRVKKVYWACVEGAVAPPEGTWKDTLRKVPGQPQAEVLQPDHPEGRPAVLHYRILQTAPWGTWLQIELETGRTHQIRVQAASRGHPVLGDAQYGSIVPFGTQHEDVRLRAVALHARSLAFCHPATGEAMSLVAPVSQDWHTLGLAIDE